MKLAEAVLERVGVAVELADAPRDSVDVDDAVGITLAVNEIVCVVLTLAPVEGVVVPDGVPNGVDLGVCEPELFKDGVDERLQVADRVAVCVKVAVGEVCVDDREGDSESDGEAEGHVAEALSDGEAGEALCEPLRELDAALGEADGVALVDGTKKRVSDALGVGDGDASEQEGRDTARTTKDMPVMSLLSGSACTAALTESAASSAATWSRTPWLACENVAGLISAANESYVSFAATHCACAGSAAMRNAVAPSAGAKISSRATNAVNA